MNLRSTNSHLLALEGSGRLCSPVLISIKPWALYSFFTSSVNSLSCSESGGVERVNINQATQCTWRVKNLSWNIANLPYLTVDVHVRGPRIPWNRACVRLLRGYWKSWQRVIWGLEYFCGFYQAAYLWTDSVQKQSRNQTVLTYGVLVFQWKEKKDILPSYHTQTFYAHLVGVRL